MITIDITGVELRQLMDLKEKQLDVLQDLMKDSSKITELACKQLISLNHDRYNQLGAIYDLYLKDRWEELYRTLQKQ